jgi:hypothetical protein
MYIQGITAQLDSPETQRIAKHVKELSDELQGAFDDKNVTPMKSTPMKSTPMKTTPLKVFWR